MTTRRECLKIAALAGVASGLGACAPLARRLSHRGFAPIALPSYTPPERHRFLNRIAFGPRPTDYKRLEELGKAAFVEEQLSGDQPEDPELLLQLSRLDVLRIDGIELRDINEDEMLRQLQTATLLRATYSQNQLRERLVDFWINHFNIYGRKGKAAWRIPGNDVWIRENALGKFPDLLAKSAKSPSMLMFLDNFYNEKGHPNENYAREIMELHTLGVDGGYTQKDVMEVARCFTGWGLERGFLKHRDSFSFNLDRHDNGEKTVLGQTIQAGGGQSDAEKVLAILSTHPSTARHISKKLCRFFLGTSETPWVDSMSETYRSTGGDIRLMLKPLLLSDDIATSPAMIKRPFDFVASSLRATDATTDGHKPILRHLAEMGQRLYEWPMPDGYPEKTSAWTGTLLARWNFAIALSSDDIAGTRVEWDRLPKGEVTRLILGEDRSLGNTDRQAVALALASPEFQWR